MTDIPDRLARALADRYALKRELGAGGMATVYLAEDLKHGRPVAIKVLKPELAAVIGAERFLHEIETTANLQHPHILPLYDSGEADGFLYYVMPYVEGETVRDRLDRETQLGVEEAVRIAAGVADALDYAHREGVIHRDIKPANVLLRDGHPLVADFGIALALSAAGGGRMTETGLSLGTPWYMSPEQAAGDRDLTPRSDLYSLGAVLYEMLAGEPPHTGPTSQAVVARILTDDPVPVTRARKSVPPHVAGATRKALEKLPADRFESGRALAEALRDSAFRYDPAREAARPRVRTRLARPAALLGWVAALVLAGAALWPGGARLHDAPAPAIAVEIDVVGQNDARIAVLDDGTIFSAFGSEIRLRRPNDLRFSTLYTDPRRVDGLAASPDGRWLAFSTFGDDDAGLYKVPATGGDVVTLLDAASADNLVWSEDGWIYFRGAGEVLRIPEDGGPVDTLLARHRRPGALIEGRALLLAGGGVTVLDLESGDTVAVSREGRMARWSPTGHILYTHPDGSLYAAPFSPRRMAVTGPARVVLDGVSTSAPQFDLSANGVLVYQAGPPVSMWGRADYWWIDARGEPRRIPIQEVDGHTDGELSPDGRRIAYIREGELRVFDLNLGTDVGLGPGNHDPVWSPDGREIAYRDDGRGGVWAVASDGTGEPRRIAALRATSPIQWLSDGTLLIASFLGDIRVVDARPGADTPPRDVLVARWQERNPSISPDGRWIAYWSDEDGVARGYVRRWPDLEGRTLITGSDTLSWMAETLHWDPDSGRLLYVRSDHAVVAVSLDTDDGLRVTDRTVVTDLGPSGPQDRDPVGDRFLVTRSTLGGEDPNALPEPNRLVLITGWLDELRRRMADAP